MRINLWKLSLLSLQGSARFCWPPSPPPERWPSLSRRSLHLREFAHRRRDYVTGAEGASDSGFPTATACGSDASANGAGATATGANATATGTYATTSGFNSSASGAQATATGDASSASGDYAGAFGAFSNAAGLEATAAGAGASPRAISPAPSARTPTPRALRRRRPARPATQRGTASAFGEGRTPAARRRPPSERPAKRPAQAPAPSANWLTRRRAATAIGVNSVAAGISATRRRGQQRSGSTPAPSARPQMRLVTTRPRSARRAPRPARAPAPSAQAAAAGTNATAVGVASIANGASASASARRQTPPEQTPPRWAWRAPRPARAPAPSARRQTRPERTPPP